MLWVCFLCLSARVVVWCGVDWCCRVLVLLLPGGLAVWFLVGLLVKTGSFLGYDGEAWSVGVDLDCSFG